RRLNPVLPQYNASLWRLICQETGSPRGEFGNGTYSTRTIRKAATGLANSRMIFLLARGYAPKQRDSERAATGGPARAVVAMFNSRSLSVEEKDQEQCRRRSKFSV